MSFTKNDLNTIKSKIRLSDELEKKVKVVKKGNDYWCCCPFHEEKTPSCKINNDLCSYYCFGCGAKGDIFTIYTDLYNFSFPDAVKELAQRVGIKITPTNFKKNAQDELIYKILECTTEWFEKNLINNEDCQKYLKNRFLSIDTIKYFRIGYSYNPKSSLYNYLKDLNFKDDDIVKSNVVKTDNNKKIKDFFYKRLMFPIANEQNKIVGFGGRVLDNSNPKYINSPESHFFKKRSLLYNLNNAKHTIRSKKNMLMCEGYMDVISLYENNIRTAVAPLGTSLTENQLLLAWRFVNIPTIMFDGDNAGLKASFKTALMALPHLLPDKYLQFINLPKNYDPDSFINKFSLKEFIKYLKRPSSIVNFIFDYASSTIDLNIANNKISFDKYIDDVVNTIKDKKIQYFYKSEFKSLFFKKLKSNNQKSKNIISPSKIPPLIKKQTSSFLLALLNHNNIRDKLTTLYLSAELFNNDELKFIKYLQTNDINNLEYDDILRQKNPEYVSKILDDLSENSIIQLFPYSRKDYESVKTLTEIEESIKNLNTRLSNLKKINKSLNEFGENLSSLSWEELKNFSQNLHLDED